MRICLVSQEYPPETASGGIGTQTWNKARYLTKLGHTVHVLSSAPNKGIKPTAEREPDVTTKVDGGITIHRIQPPGREFPVYEAPTYWVGYTWHILQQLNRLLSQVKFDVIDVAEYGAEGFAYLLDRTSFNNWAPVVVQLHGPLAMFSKEMNWPEQNADFYKVGTFMEELCIKKADALMSCSANIADFAAKFYGVAREAIDVVHCGVDAESFQPSQAIKTSEERPTIIFVGNVAETKGIKTVLEAVLLLRAKYPKILLKILGTGNAEIMKSFKIRIHEANAEANVEFAGFVDRARMPEFYQQAHIFASPAQHEMGVANVYLEALACGCPVVASTSGGAPEAVSNGVSGFLVPPNDPAATASAFEKILSNPALRQKMGAMGRKRVEDYFAMDKYILRILTVYEKAIEFSREKTGSSKAVTV